MVKALTMRLRPTFAAASRLWPQYAYTPGRSIEHAIARALHHCAQVRHTLASHRLRLKERRATGNKPTSCQGGATLSIDTSKAFDTVDRRVQDQGGPRPGAGARNHPQPPSQYRILAGGFGP